MLAKFKDIGVLEELALLKKKTYFNSYSAPAHGNGQNHCSQLAVDYRQLCSLSMDDTMPAGATSKAGRAHMLSVTSDEARKISGHLPSLSAFEPISQMYSLPDSDRTLRTIQLLTCHPYSPRCKRGYNTLRTITETLSYSGSYCP